MADEIGKISLVADTSSLERATNELDKFAVSGNKAATAADSLNDSNAQTSAKVKDVNAAFAAGAAVREQTRRSYEGTTKELQGLQRELVAIRGRVDPVGVAFDNLAAMSDKLREGLRQGLIDPADYAASVKGIDNLTNSLERSVYESSAAGKAAKEAAQADKLATVAKESFISRLREQAETQGKTNSEILAYKAAQLGATQEAAPFIASLKQQENAWKSSTISAGQYRQAMRQLPMQITDVVTSLASGMPIYMVAIQQGGQIKDSFGGMGNAAKALISQLTPMRLLVGGLATGAVALATAYYQGSQESQEFNKQLILTGNYAGKTAGQLQNLAKSFSGKGITQHDAASALASVIGSGAFKSNQIESVTKAALAMQQATGQAVDETIKNFQRLYENPTQGSIELNKQLHYLTSSQYEYIASLERRGFKEAAGQAAADVYSKAEQQRSQQVIDNLGYIERSIKTAINWWNKYYDAARGIGREDTNSTQLQAVRDRIKQLSDNSKPGAFGLGGIGDGGASAKELEALKSKEKELEFVINSQEGYAQSQIKAKEADEKRTKSLVYQNDILSKNVSWQQKRSAALTELWRNISLAPKDWSQEQRTRAVAQINADHKPPTKKKEAAYKVGAGESLLNTYDQQSIALQSQLRVLQQHTSINDTISQQRKSLWETEAKIQVLDAAAGHRKLKTDEQSLLANRESVLAKAEEVAKLGDQIAEQQKLNQLQDISQKYVIQQNEKRQALISSTGKSNRLAQRENELAQLRLGWINQGGKLTDENYKNEESALKKRYSIEDELRADWLSGAKRGWSEYLDNATDVYSSIANVSTSVFTGLSDTLTNFVTTGKASFADFTTSILKMTLQITNQLLIAKMVKSSLGGTAIGGFFGIQAYNGGYIPEFAAGGYTGNGGKYEPRGIVHGGEFVFTKESTSRIGTDNLYALMRGYANGGLVGGSSSGRAPMLGLQGGGSASGPIIQTSVVVNNEGGQQQQGGNSDAIGKAYQQVIDTSVRDGISKALRPGGLIWMAQNKR
ncbi:phage tail tape measure protein [Obesumbacterium proteus]|nr:phage tail tape measure protein [Obesumbacterium proteus]